MRAAPRPLLRSGIRSRASIPAAVAQLQSFDIIGPVRKFIKPGEKKVRNAYKLTLDDPDLLARIELAYGAHRFANEQARNFADANRKLRSHSRKETTKQADTY